MLNESFQIKQPFLRLSSFYYRVTLNWWTFLVFRVFVLGAQHKINLVELKPASSLIVPLQKAQYGDFSILEWLTGSGTMLSIRCGEPVGLKTSI